MLANWVKETTTTTGSSDVTLSAITGFPRFSEAFAVGELCLYGITTNDQPPQPLEWGIGTIGASNTLVRSVVLGTYASGVLNTTNPTAVSLASGTHNVICANAMGAHLPGLPAVDTTNGSSGAVVPYPWTANVSGTAIASTADRLYLLNFRWACLRKVTAIKMRVSTGAAGNCRIGIYKAGTDGKPGALLYSSGDIDTTNVGIITWTFSSAKILPPGWYFLGVATKGITPSFNTFTQATVGQVCETLVGVDSTAVQAILYKYVALSGGWTSLPDPPSSTQTSVTSPPPLFSIVTG